MFCQNCGNQIKENEMFCANCGNKVIKELQSIRIDNLKNKTKSNKTKRDLLIIIIIIILTIGGLTIYFIINKNSKIDELPPNKEQNENIVEEDNSKANSTYQKLQEDYDNGIIDVNKYFTELVYYEYDSSKLDENYKSDEIYYSTGCQSKLLELLENHKDELNSDIVKEYIENVTLHNVSLGDGVTVQPQSNLENKYEVKLLDNEEEKSNAKNHRLDKVILSSNENFLIWYTDVGSDAITEEQLQQISSGLEISISKFEETFGIEYSYFPYQDTIFNDDYKNAKEVLKKNGIPVAKINSAMSIYIYDTGSANTLATYFQPYGAYLILDFVVQLGLNDGDGIVTFPYIVINKQGFSTENESLKQLYAHELFHHFQYLFCRSSSRERCVAGDYYTEGVANFAATITSGVNSTNNFLNNWSGIYTKKISSKLQEVTDGASYGYGTFPYWYAYSQVANNWSEVLMNAHNEIDPYTYINTNTSKEDLVKISEYLSYNVLTNNFKNKSLYSNESISIEEVINIPKIINESINGGAIKYYEISGNNTLKVISGNNDYVGIKFYGYKDGVYNEIVSSMNEINVDLTYYVRYDKFYLAIFNADIINSNSYTIELINSEYEENSNFVTTFNNYNIEMEMNMTIAGIETKTISKGIVDELHQKEYLDITTTSMGLISLNNKMYYDFNTGYSYMTQPYGGDVWWKEKSVSQTIDIGTILSQLISMNNVTKVDDNHYKIKMTPEDVKGLMTQGNTEASLIQGDIYVEVYTENGYITKLEYDFSNLISGFDVFTTTIKYSNYDTAGDVEIPQSIIDNAVEQ